MDAARIAMYGAAAFTIVLVGAVIYDEFAPPPAPDNAQVVADFCLGDHSNIGVHYHPIIEIVINGQQVTIPANTGINHDGCSMRGVHTHDSSGKIHIEMDKSTMSQRSRSSLSGGRRSTRTRSSTMSWTITTR